MKGRRGMSHEAPSRIVRLCAFLLFFAGTLFAQDVPKDYTSWDRDAVWSPDGTLLAFVSHRDGNAEIYRMRPDGGDLRRLTENPATDDMPVWSPDGSRIAFTSDREGSSDIYVIDAERTYIERLTRHPAADFSPAWSPDGRWIAFVSMRDGNSELYRVEVATRAVERLTSSPGADYAPAWSPDGSRIAFVSGRDGNFEIYVIDADGGNPRNVTRDPNGDVAVAWSPNGDRLVVISDRDGSRDLYLLDMESGETRPLRSRTPFERWAARRLRLLRDYHPRATEEMEGPTRPYLGISMDGDGALTLFEFREGRFRPLSEAEPPTWLGENERIAMVPLGRDWEIFLTRTDGSSPRRYVNEWVEMPEWSPDGSRIVFMLGRENGQGNLYLVDADGGKLRLLAGDSADPDQAEAPTEPSNPTSCNYVYDRDGRLIYRIEGSPTVYMNPHWSPDGRTIVVTSDRDTRGDLDIYTIDLVRGEIRNLTSRP